MCIRRLHRLWVGRLLHDDDLRSLVLTSDRAVTVVVAVQASCFPRAILAMTVWCWRMLARADSTSLGAAFVHRNAQYIHFDTGFNMALSTL